MRHLPAAQRAPDELWQALRALRFDAPGIALSFPERLARENGWSPDEGRRVCEEYKRFLYLVAVGGEPLTPSDAVDQAWHLHLTYTRSYWEHLCRRVLGFDLHHEPTEGGAQEQRRFARQYRRTLERYREAFGAAPPPDIWPGVEQRLRAAEAFVRVDRGRTWLVPKPSRTLPWLLGGSALATACSASASDALFVVKAVVAVAIGYVAIKVVRWFSGGSGKGGGCAGGSGCSGYGGGCGS